ncbi:hypothetical protein Ae201684_012896 [Aphanomyces euteiches]|uniref:BZIP domain-containing protein n=1 Tax=Aphanomyces euteiches TaxID=100861 RepID=A0A6G0WPV5_9STRA|nr:hypothetical protein Ae201684_012896 [Aphanomyces euteiches]
MFSKATTQDANEQRKRGMESPPLQSLEETNRLAETIRKRKYRAAKRNEAIQLEVQVRRLEAYLARLQSLQQARQLARIKAENACLRSKTDQYRCLLQLLSDWTQLNHYPQKALSNKPTFIETTLLAHPITRRQGIQWLSERVYNQACLVLPLNHPYRGQIDDAFALDVHLSDDIDEEGTTIAALETHYQFTACTDYYSAARVHWDTILGEMSAISRELIDQVDDRFMYCHHRNRRIGTHILSVTGFFKEKNRVVITNCFKAKDEVFPLANDVLRPYGFAWTVYEAMTPDITLVHNLSMQYTPVTSNGEVIPLEMIGRLFGRSSDGIQHRETYIAQIQTAAEAAFIDTHKAIVRDMTARMEKTSPLNG